MFHLHYFKKKVIEEVDELEARIKFAKGTPSEQKEDRLIELKDIDRLIKLKDSIDWYLENRPQHNNK